MDRNLTNLRHEILEFVRYNGGDLYDLKKEFSCDVDRAIDELIGVGFLDKWTAGAGCKKYEITDSGRNLLKQLKEDDEKLKMIINRFPDVTEYEI